MTARRAVGELEGACRDGGARGERCRARAPEHRCRPSWSAPRAGRERRTRGQGPGHRGARRPSARVSLPKRLVRFLREVVAELRKVIWPTRKQLVTYTLVVLVFVSFMVALVALLDFLVRQGRQLPCSARDRAPTRRQTRKRDAQVSTQHDGAGLPGGVDEVDEVTAEHDAPTEIDPEDSTETAAEDATDDGTDDGHRAEAVVADETAAEEERRGDPVEALRAALRTRPRRLVRRALLRRLREQGEDQPRDAASSPSTWRTTSSRSRCRPKRSSRSRTASASRCSARSSRLHPGADGPQRRVVGRGAQHAGRHRLRRRHLAPVAADPRRGRQDPRCPAEPQKAAAGAARPAGGAAGRQGGGRGRLRGRRVGHRHGRPVRHPAGDDQRDRRRCTRSCRSWCRSSAARPRSSCRSARSSKI